jgi:hypothetical protein
VHYLDTKQEVAVDSELTPEDVLFHLVFQDTKLQLQLVSHNT